MHIDDEVLQILENRPNQATNESNNEFKVGDQVYLQGDYGISGDKWEIIEITDSHDEKLKEDRNIPMDQRPLGTYHYEPEKDAFPVAILKQISGNKIGRLLFDSVAERDTAYGYSNYAMQPTYNFIAADVVEAYDPANLNLTELATGLESALANVGLNITGIQLRYEEPKDNAKYGKIRMTSSNLAQNCGIWAFAVKELTLDDWGGSYMRPTRKVLEINMHYSYEHWSGGTNGCDIGYAIYEFESNSWKIELKKDAGY